MAKDTDWGWAYENEDECTNAWTSESRKWAKDDTPKLRVGQFSKCRACRGTNTTVIYHTSGANADGTVVEEELLCMDCGKYTQYRFDDRV